MTVKNIHAQSLKDALDILETLALGNEQFIFRGHSNPKWHICSTLSRHTSISDGVWNIHIDGMLAHFVTNLRSIDALPNEIIGDRRSLLEYGRHYGVPSPLIDFSLSPYLDFIQSRGIAHRVS
jgi:FRG domain